jgi:hypothetical protein
VVVAAIVLVACGARRLSRKPTSELPVIVKPGLQPAAATA